MTTTFIPAVVPEAKQAYVLTSRLPAVIPDALQTPLWARGYGLFHPYSLNTPGWNTVVPAGVDIFVTPDAVPRLAEIRAAYPYTRNNVYTYDAAVATDTKEAILFVRSLDSVPANVSQTLFDRGYKDVHTYAITSSDWNQVAVRGLDIYVAPDAMYFLENIQKAYPTANIYTFTKAETKFELSPLDVLAGAGTTKEFSALKQTVINKQWTQGQLDILLTQSAANNQTYVTEWLLENANFSPDALQTALLSLIRICRK